MSKKNNNILRTKNIFLLIHSFPLFTCKLESKQSFTKMSFILYSYIGLPLYNLSTSKYNQTYPDYRKLWKRVFLRMIYYSENQKTLE